MRMEGPCRARRRSKRVREREGEGARGKGLERDEGGLGVVVVEGVEVVERESVASDGGGEGSAIASTEGEPFDTEGWPSLLVSSCFCSSLRVFEAVEAEGVVLPLPLTCFFELFLSFEPEYESRDLIVGGS